MTLEEEIKEFAEKQGFRVISNLSEKIDNSFEIEKIEYAISVLKKFTDEYGWFQAIEDLEKKLKQLQQ